MKSFVSIFFLLLKLWSLHSFIINRYNNIRQDTSLNIAIAPEAIKGMYGEDIVWDTMRKDAQLEASKEPLLASFMHATILSHNSLERAIAFHIANLLSSPAMISTQIQALILEVLLLLKELRKYCYFTDVCLSEQ